MGVMPCSRYHCDNILVENDLGDYRICDSCIEELRQFLTDSSVVLTFDSEVSNAVDRFMQTPKGRLQGGCRATMVGALLDQMIRRR